MKPVLAILDPDLRLDQPALVKAVQVARQLHCPLQVYVNCWDAPTARAIGLDDERLQKAIEALMGGWERHLNARLDELGAGDVELHLVFEMRDLPFLSNLVLDIEPRLLVVHARDTSLLQRLTITPLHWTLIRKAPCPVLCVSDAPWPKRPAVVAAVDIDESESPLNAAILSQADALAAAVSGEVHGVHVVEYPDETLITLSESELVVAMPSPAEIVEEKRAALASLIGQQVRSAHQYEVLEGNPASELASYMESHPGILVMGTVYRGPVKRLLLGSTAERILQHSQNDVLVVKAYDFQTPWQRSED